MIPLLLIGGGGHCRSCIDVIEAHCHISTGARINGGARVGAASFVGSGAILREGVVVGSNSVIGAGQLVLRNLPPKTILRSPT
ncbi:MULTISPECIES: hypothetical protein [unclassified Thiocapsa]|uniref:hypothetical protein n=1 Tax=unclassified Thiocapsa TaxID=2641286 RepID=UPI0035B358A1